MLCNHSASSGDYRKGQKKMHQISNQARSLMPQTVQQGVPAYHSGLTARLMRQEKEAAPATENLPSNQKMLNPTVGYEDTIERLQDWLV